MYIKVVFAALGVLLGGILSYVASGIFLVVLIVVPSVLLGQTDTVQAAVDHSFHTHPQGIFACGMLGLMSLGALAGAWFGWRCSVRLFTLLPADALYYSPVAFVFMLLMLGFLCLWNLPNITRLVARHETTVGHLVQLFPQAHGTVSYTYAVRGRSFEQIDHAENFDHSAVGDAVTVYYSPDEPTLSTLEGPSSRLLNNFLNFLLVSVFISIMPFGFGAVKNWAASLPKSQYSEADLR